MSESLQGRLTTSNSLLLKYRQKFLDPRLSKVLTAQKAARWQLSTKRFKSFGDDTERELSERRLDERCYDVIS